MEGSNHCARHCNVALNEGIYEGDSCDTGDCPDLEDLLDDTASNLCDGCTSPASCPDQPNAEPRCINNQCTTVATP